MASRAKSLMKKLRIQHKEEIQENKEDSTKENPRPSITDVHKAGVRSVSSNTGSRRTSFIDPLEYFNKERIVVKPENMDQYIVKKEEVLKEIQEDMEKENEALCEKEKERELKRKKVGAVAPKGARINFEEMMKARQMVKSSDKKKSNSVQTRHRADSNTNEIGSISVERKSETSYEQNLYIKLVLARNKYNQRFKNTKNIFEQIITKMKELKDIKEMPEHLLKEIEDLYIKLHLPEGLIMDPDVQTVSTDDDASDPIGVKVNLDDLVKNFKPEATTN